MLIQLEIFLTIALVLGLLVMSVLDFALTWVNRIAVRRMTEDRSGRPGRLMTALTQSRSEVLMVVHISIQAILVALAVLMTGTFLTLPFSLLAALLLALGTTLLIVLAFRQLIPRAIALRDPAGILEFLIPVLVVPYFLLGPVVGLITSILQRFHQWEAAEEPEEDASEDEIRAFIDAGQEEGILERDEGLMVQSIVQFGDKVALEVMTPRTQIVAVDITSSLEKVVDQILLTRHSRIPVYRDELDHIEGFVHERDLLRISRKEKQPEHVRSIIQPVHFVPETKPVDDLLEEMKHNGQQLVLVIDEYGGVSGLITIEDLLEEIVGEISDGSDTEGVKLTEDGRGSYVVSGTTELDTLDVKLGFTAFPETECTTVGGAVVELFGRLPLPGERVNNERLSIEVMDADRRKVRSLRIRSHDSGPGS